MGAMALRHSRAGRTIYRQHFRPNTTNGNVRWIWESGDCYGDNGIDSNNNDNNNDVLYVRGGGVSSIQFRVFDKWGNIVFESFDMEKGWDGTYNGKLLNTGVYVYRMDATLKNGEPLFESGNVTLFR